MYSGDTTISNVVVSMGASLMFPAGPGRGNMIITNGGIIDMQGRTEVFDGLLGNGTIDNFAGATKTASAGPLARGRALDGACRFKRREQHVQRIDPEHLLHAQRPEQ